MANTSMTLGEHWELFIKSEVVRDALPTLEERKMARYCTEDQVNLFGMSCPGQGMGADWPFWRNSPHSLR